MKLTPEQRAQMVADREYDNLRESGYRSPQAKWLAELWEDYYSMQGQVDRAKRGGGRAEE